MKLKIYIKTYSIVALTLSTFQGTERNLKLRGGGKFLSIPNPAKGQNNMSIMRHSK